MSIFEKFSQYFVDHSDFEQDFAGTEYPNIKRSNAEKLTQALFQYELQRARNDELGLENIYLWERLNKNQEKLERSRAATDKQVELNRYRDTTLRMVESNNKKETRRLEERLQVVYEEGLLAKRCCRNLQKKLDAKSDEPIRYALRDLQKKLDAKHEAKHDEPIRFCSFCGGRLNQCNSCCKN